MEKLIENLNIQIVECEQFQNYELKVCKYIIMRDSKENCEKIVDDIKKIFDNPSCAVLEMISHPNDFVKAIAETIITKQLSSTEEIIEEIELLALALSADMIVGGFF